MQFSITRQSLLKLLRIVAGVVERRALQNPILSNVLLKLDMQQLAMLATDQEIEVVAKEQVTAV